MSVAILFAISFAILCAVGIHETLYIALWQLVEHGEYAAASTFIQRGIGPNHVFGMCSPLIDRIRARDEKGARFLLEHGADPNFYPTYPMVSKVVDPGPLTIAIDSAGKDMGLIRALLDHGANVRADYPLLEACILNRPDIATILLERGANPREYNGRSYPIDIARQNKNRAMVAVLAKYGGLPEPLLR